jgi:hypothetical protein
MTQHPAPDLWQHLVHWQPATAAAIIQHIRALPDDWPQRVFGVGRPDATLTLPPAAIGEQYPDQTPEIAPYDDVADPESCPACTEAAGNCRWHEGFAQGHHDRVQAQIDAMKLRPDMPLREYALWEAEVSEALDNGQTPPALPAAPSEPADTDRREQVVRAAVLREAAGQYERLLANIGADTEQDPRYWTGVHHVITGLRRMADEAQQVEARASQNAWRVELYDPAAEEWVPGSSLADLAAARARLAHARSRSPKWKDDDTHVQRRIVRETTTYTVEAPQADTAGEGR